MGNGTTTQKATNGINKTKGDYNIMKTIDLGTELYYKHKNDKNLRRNVY